MLWSPHTKPADRRTIIGAAAIMLAALFWSIDGLFIRPEFYSLPAASVVFLEHFLGFIALSPFIFIFWNKIKSLSRKSWGAILWVSAFGGMLGTIMITKAFFAAADGEITFATVVILQKLQPVFALLLARIILKEKLPKQFYLWAILAIIASYFLAFGKTGLNIREIDWFHNGALFAFAAAFAFGSSTVFGKRIANHLDYKAVAALRFGITALLVLILILITGSISTIGEVTAWQWRLLILVVFTSGAGAMFIYYFGLRRVSASGATILELFWPFSALILDYIFNKNYLNISQIIAFLILLFAFYKISALDKFNNISFKARVIAGRGMGKKLGYPTANLDKTDLDIPHGVYKVSVDIREKNYSGLMHFGFKESFGEPVSLEVLIKDFTGDIYGQEIGVKIIRRLRDIKKFPDSEALVKAIEKDSTE